MKSILFLQKLIRKLNTINCQKNKQTITMTGIGDYLALPFYYIRKLIYTNNKQVIYFHFKSHEYNRKYNFIYIYWWKDNPKILPERFLEYLTFNDYKIISACFKNDVRLLRIIFKYYEKLFYSKSPTNYIAPYIFCNYFDLPNTGLYYHYYDKHTSINKYLTEIAQLRLQMEKYDLFISCNFTHGYKTFIVKKTNNALNILQKNYNLNDDILHIIKEFIFDKT